MSEDESRRLTDREVALVLERASEIEEREGTDGATGVSIEELKEIAREVGISPEAISRAVDQLDRGRARVRHRGGAPSTHKAVHAVRGELNEEALSQLIRLVDDETDATGAISEALGSVRWTTGDRFHSMSVSLTPEGGETVIQVTEKARVRLRRVVTLVPTAWATMLAGAVVGSADLAAGGSVLALFASAAAGAGIGRFVWNRLSERSRARVERLAASLSRKAYDASKKGMLVGSGGDEE